MLAIHISNIVQIRNDCKYLKTALLRAVLAKALCQLAIETFLGFACGLCARDDVFATRAKPGFTKLITTAFAHFGESNQRTRMVKILLAVCANHVPPLSYKPYQYTTIIALCQ
jgi:hypothetical protein